MDVEKKRKEEQETVGLMIEVYCRGKHKKAAKTDVEGTREKERCHYQLCPKCQELFEYASIRTQKCPFMETKTFCSACKVHCYAPDKKERIREVMKYAGPRMMKYHPILAIKHVCTTIAKKRKVRKEEKNVS